MRFKDSRVEEIKIAYIGGGSRQWARGLMSDLIVSEDISGDVYLYDIDYEAALINEKVGNNSNFAAGAKTTWNYKAVKTIEEALFGANFVVISIQPGTFDEMYSDVHTPEKYGIYQSVGDTTGPGGIVRALRTIPMYEHFALKIKECCPDAWVINYTNPMTVCTNTLYKVFPEIKAFGCCHEVFATQKLLIEAMEEVLGLTGAVREDIKVNPIGINHFTWLTEAKYQNIDLYPIYREYALKHKETGLIENRPVIGYMGSREKVKFDLFLRYGIIAAAGDRHLAEFCPGDWYLKNPEQVEDWQFKLTPVDWRRTRLADRIEEAKLLASGEKKFEITETGEDGVKQIRALLGLHDLVTNVNLPNKGQIPNLPYDAVVETNAIFRSDCIVPVFGGEIPYEIYPLISRVCGEQEMIVNAGLNRDLNLAYKAFINDPLVRISLDDSKKLFGEMLYNTKDYLKMYDIGEWIENV